MQGITIKVVYDAKVIDEQFASYSPYSLKRDTKSITEKTLEGIANGIADEIYHGPGRPAYVVLYKSNKYTSINCSKIRVEDIERKKGKSGGFRCIVLVDEIHKYGFLLHIYTHSGVDNISQGEKNQLKKLVEEYVKAVSV